jgi:MurNAc alpha-1-phosphate uridylyltransferase
MSRAAMILAAGFGTRMGALTRDCPKPLLQVAGRPLLAHAMQVARGCAPVVVNGHYHGDQIERWLGSHEAEARFVLEQPEILDSGGAVKNALPLLGGDPILTLNADAVWSGPDPHALLEEAWDGARMDALMLLVPRGRAVGRSGGGDVARAPDGRLTWDRSAAGLVYTGAQILATDAIAARVERVFSLRAIWDDMIAQGRLFGVLYPGHWADVGQPEGIALAERMLNGDTAL